MKNEGSPNPLENEQEKVVDLDWIPQEESIEFIRDWCEKINIGIESGVIKLSKEAGIILNSLKTELEEQKKYPTGAWAQVTPIERTIRKDTRALIELLKQV